jgi:hypothetical protein
MKNMIIRLADKAGDEFPHGALEPLFSVIRVGLSGDWE